MNSPASAAFPRSIVFVALMVLEATAASGFLQNSCYAADLPVELRAYLVKCYTPSQFQLTGVDSLYFAYTAGKETKKGGDSFSIKAGETVTPNALVWQSAIGDSGKMIFQFHMCVDRHTSNDPHIGDIELEAERLHGGEVKLKWIPEHSSHANMQDPDHPKKDAPDKFVLNDSHSKYLVKLTVLVDGKHVEIPVRTH